MMKISQVDMQYLNGDKFSSGFRFKIARQEYKITTRIEVIKKWVNGKKTIHLGCCDHLPLIDQKISTGTWIHKIITDNSAKCLGIDVNGEALDYVKKLGYDNCVFGNITSENIVDEIFNENWDIMVMGEILEHIDNPVDFLKKIRDNYKEKIKQLLITVPNAFAIDNFSAAHQNLEVINSDHRYWFSPFTLAKIGINAGYIIDQYYFTQDMSEKIGPRAKVKVIPYLKRKQLIWKLKKYPGLRGTLIMIMNL